jgi:hypothetical protein
MSKTIELQERFHPFSNGSQFMDWQESNCCRCKKYNVQPDTGLEREGDCTIMDALGLASITDGSVDESTARRMGYLEGNKEAGDYIWMCGEVDWTEEHMLIVANKAGFKTLEGFNKFLKLENLQVTLLFEISEKVFKRRDVARTYRLVMQEDVELVDWKAVNQAIIARWSKSGLEWIKKEAHHAL